MPVNKTLEIYNSTLSANVMCYFRYEIKPLKNSNLVYRSEVTRVEGSVQVKNDMPFILLTGQRLVLQSRTASGTSITSAILECILKG